ncbi:MAG: hypothetical protein ASARMPRED_005604 [Alectoria sarmentosa]|nr:MAG: hypothetical protein ASARMPRED_005604 [Alectoria sarmentosa]
MSAGTTPRLLRLSISLYHSPSRSGAEAYEFATNNHAVQAAKIHANHGIHSYIQYFSPLNVRKTLDEMNRHLNRGWVVDDHDMTVEFYFRSFEEMNKVTNDPEFQKLQEEEEPYVNRTHTVVSLGWVESYVLNEEVVNVKDGKSTYGTFEESSDLSNVLPRQPAATSGAQS